MSSATSTDLAGSSAAAGRESANDGLRPWQFFVLGGMLAATATVIVATGQSPASIITLSVTVLAASLVGLGAYRALMPLVAPDTVDSSAVVAGRARDALEREKLLVLRSIKELEFDRGMGKVDAADFEEMSARLRARAIGLMRQLDSGSAYRELIERELQARTKHAPPVAPSVARDVSPAIEQGAPLYNCHACQTVNDPDARFCKKCGHKLAS